MQARKWGGGNPLNRREVKFRFTMDGIKDPYDGTRQTNFQWLYCNRPKRGYRMRKLLGGTEGGVSGSFTCWLRGSTYSNEYRDRGDIII